MKTEILITSVPHREEVVAEIWCDDRMWAELSKNGGPLTVRMWGMPSGEAWVFAFDEAIDLLQEARRDLTGDTT